MKTFYFLVFLLAVLFGYFLGKGPPVNKEKLKEESHQECALREYKSFAIIVYSYKDVSVCERMLQSIFAQEYDHFRIFFFDDGSQDGTAEKVQSFVLEAKQDHRFILIQNEERLGPVACLYRAVENLRDQEIAIPIQAKDWLAHPKTLNRLNAAYQNPDVWLALSMPILYPSYERIEASSFSVEDVPGYVPISFYAGLFKRIQLAGLVREGRFVSNRNAYLIPMLQMSEEHFRILTEPLFIANLTICQREEKYKPLASYPRINSVFGMNPIGEPADIVLFSFDRPMQLFACLESIHRYILNYGQIFVLCRATHPRYAAAYEKVKQTFPEVRFIFQGTDYKKDFKPLLLQALFHSPSPYVMFGVDDQIVKDYTDLKTCTEMMKRTGAYGFYLRLGNHISYSYQGKKDQTVPVSIPLMQNVYAWNIQSGFCDWDFPNNLDMTIYRKKSLSEAFKKMRYKNPNNLEFCWARDFQPENEIGLYFESSKVVNVPLNVVSQTGNPHMNYLSPDQLLSKFEEDLKINIDPLFRVENPSPHIEYYPEFISR